MLGSVVKKCLLTGVNSEELWATFNAKVGADDNGNSSQTLQLTPGSELSFLLLPVITDFCDGNRPGDLDSVCQERGLFRANLSGPWKQYGHLNRSSELGRSIVFEGDNSTEQSAGFGLIDTELEIVDAPTDTMVSKGQGQFMGLFGLLTNPLLFDGRLYVQDALLGSFFYFNNLPSPSFSYTAGSFASNKTPPSLVLGGYDNTRFDSATTLQFDITNTGSFPDLHKFEIYIRSIKMIRKPDPALVNTWVNETVSISLSDSGTTLPSRICEPLERYGENGTDIIFTISSTRPDVPESRDLTMPSTVFSYAEAAPDVLQYLPSMNCSSEGPFTLDRIFLQHVYLSVDYGRAKFSLSQAKYTNGTKPSLTRIDPLPYLPPPKTRNRTLTTGHYAGIGVGAASAVLGVAILALSWRKKWLPFSKRKHNAKQDQKQDPYEKAELGGESVEMTKGKGEAMGTEVAELENREYRPEAMGEERLELETCEPRLELIGDKEQSDIPGLNEVHEMDGGKVELKNREPKLELTGIGERLDIPGLNGHDETDIGSSRTESVDTDKDSESASSEAINT